MSNTVSLKDALTAGIPREHYGHILSEVVPRNEEQKKLIEMCMALLKDTQAKKRRTLVILGTVGNGKSYIACSTLQSYLNCYPWEARYITQERLVGECKESFENGGSENKVIRKYAGRDTKVLVIDELTTRGWTEYAKNIVQRILSERHDNVVSTILIGNLDTETFKTMFDEHIISRLRIGDTIIMEAKDMRQHEA
jgi:DNA replication protein DnaC